MLREEGNQCLNLPVTLFTFLDHISITSYERTLIGGHLMKKSQETVTIRLKGMTNYCILSEWP